MDFQIIDTVVVYCFIISTKHPIFWVKGHPLFKSCMCISPIVGFLFNATFGKFLITFENYFISINKVTWDQMRWT